MPAKYYVDRGFSPEILDRYDVGLCTDPTKPFFERVVVPVFDAAGSGVVGVTGRSVRDDDSRVKWKHQDGFSTGNHLYNWWSAREHLHDSTVVVVEGPADVWRLEEAGIHCGVAIFGTSLTDRQQAMLEQQSPRYLVPLLDQDQAGIKGRALIKQKCGGWVNIRERQLPDGKDVGDMTVEELRQLLNGVVR